MQREAGLKPSLYRQAPVRVRFPAACADRSGFLDPCAPRVYSPPPRSQVPFPYFHFPCKEEMVMSFRRSLWVFVAAVCLAAPVAVQAQGDYLDVLIVKKKPKKRGDSQPQKKKGGDANRRFNGDRWIAMESVYGDTNVYQFTSNRKDYAEIDTGNDTFVAAMSKAFGKEAAQKMEQDFNNCVVWSRTELRHRRWDLSRKPPQDAEAYAKLIGESRLLR